MGHSLDCVNNVASVGHSHPQLVDAVCRQMELINTNTRYMSQTIAEYAERLTQLFPDPLKVVFFVNRSASHFHTPSIPPEVFAIHFLMYNFICLRL